MPYYIDLSRNIVFVSAPPTEESTSLEAVDTKFARQLKLRHGQPLSLAQIQAIRARSEQEFLVAEQPSKFDSRRAWLTPSTTPRPATTSPSTTAGLASQIGLPQAGSRAILAATIVEGIAWVAFALSWIVGIVLFLEASSLNMRGGAQLRVIPGLAVIVGGSINCLMIIMVAAYIKAKMELARLER